MSLPATYRGTPPAIATDGAGRPLTSLQKAAILLMLFGNDVATEVMRQMSPVDVQRLSAAMYGLGSIPRSSIDAILDEVIGLFSTETGVGAGAGQFVRHVLNEALGSDKAQSVLSRITPASAESPIEILDWMDAGAIAELIGDEHPQIVALVIASLEHAQAAEVLKLLPPDLQPEIIRRIAEISNVQPEAVAELESVLQRKFKANTTLRSSQIGGVKSAARILNFARQAMEQRILKDIRKEDKALVEALVDNMFVFENLVKSDDRALQTLLREIDQQQLSLALKGADETVQERLLSCVSQRAADNIRDEMEAMGPVRLTAVQEAQKQVIAVAREMSDNGRITLAGRGGEAMV